MRAAKILAIAAMLLLCGQFRASAQVFTFECFCGYLTPADANCDICGPQVQSRFFKGIIIRKDGAAFKWIEEPYTVKFLGTAATFLEVVPNPEMIKITMAQTPYATLTQYKEAIACPCAGATVEVDTPIIGNGSSGNPITIGQFGADTTMFLRWNGHHWYPSKIRFKDLLLDLPYFTGDSSAVLAGLMPGDAYLLECNNDYGLPAGIFKVVKFCNFDCAFAIRYYPNDANAISGGVPVGKEYVLDEFNLYGVLYGFIKVVTNDTLTTGTLECDTLLPHYTNDIAGITGGLTYGDIYNMSPANTYGAPAGMQRAVSNVSSTSADPQVCCNPDDNLPFYPNDAAAVSGGLSPGSYYYLTVANTYGYPWGTKKEVQ